MSYLDRTGTFKAMPLEWGMTKTNEQGLPQFKVKFFLTEFYEPNEAQWFDVTDQQWTMIGYFLLFHKKSGNQPQPTLNHTQVCSVFGWDGKGFSYLTDTDFTNLTCQVRVEDNNYAEAKFPYQIVWVDKEDVDPNPKLKVLSKEDVKKLELEFQSVMVKNTKSSKAVSAPLLPFEPEKKLSDTENVNKLVEIPQEPGFKLDKKAELAAKSKILKEKLNKAKLKVAENHPPKSEKDTVNSYGKRQAWLDCVEVKNAMAEDLSDDDFRALWNKAIEQSAPNQDEDLLTPDGWKNVKKLVISSLN
jgi:hypothetical protein